MIEFLQEQVQDLTSELEDANAYVEFLQVQPMPPDVPNQLEGMEKKTTKRLKEFLTLTLSMKV